MDTRSRKGPLDNHPSSSAAIRARGATASPRKPSNAAHPTSRGLQQQDSLGGSEKLRTCLRAADDRDFSVSGQKAVQRKPVLLEPKCGAPPHSLEYAAEFNRLLR